MNHRHALLALAIGASLALSACKREPTPASDAAGATGACAWQGVSVSMSLSPGSVRRDDAAPCAPTDRDPGPDGPYRPAVTSPRMVNCSRAARATASRVAARRASIDSAVSDTDTSCS